MSARRKPALDLRDERTQVRRGRTWVHLRDDQDPHTRSVCGSFLVTASSR
jgi:hypothetical protein